MALRKSLENAQIISDFFGGDKGPRGSIDASYVRLAVQSILIRSNDDYVAPTAEWGTANVIDIVDYDETQVYEFNATVAGTGIKEDSGTGSGLDENATGSEYCIVAGGFENVSIDVGTGRISITGKIVSDITGREIVVAMTNAYYETVEIAITLNIALPVVP
jgi:hypothetical protein